MKIFSRRTPIVSNRRMQAIAAEPAPRQVMIASSMRLPWISSALIKPAAVTIAVPCWSSWNTGILHRSISADSISKHSGALMSSRLMPPNVPAMFDTVEMNSCVSSVSTSMSMELMPAKRLKRSALPSITGLLARLPRLPSPNTAVPLLMTATKLPLLV